MSPRSAANPLRVRELLTLDDRGIELLLKAMQIHPARQLGVIRRAANSLQNKAPN